MRNHGRHRRAVGHLLLLLAVVGIAAASPAGGADDGLLDPKATEAMRRMSDVLSEVRTLRVRTDSYEDVIDPAGVKIKRSATQEVVLRRPDRLHFMSVRDDGAIREAWYDGTMLTIAHHGKAVYTRIETPGTVDGMLDFIQDNYPVRMPVADLLYSDPFARFEEYLLSGLHLGRQHVAGVAVDHLSFESTGADWQIWIDADGLPRMLVIDFVSVPGQPGHMSILHDWVLDGPVDEAMFSFTPQPGWRQIDIARIGTADD